MAVPIEEEVSDCKHPGRESCRRYCLHTLRINGSDLAEDLDIPDSNPRKIDLSLSTRIRSTPGINMPFQGHLFI